DVFMTFVLCHAHVPARVFIRPLWLRQVARYSTKKGASDSGDWRYNPDVNATVPYDYKSAWELKQDVWKREQRSKIIDEKLGSSSRVME
ncbi:hypothetical protein FOZ62_004063, partial [Perkinsus olseni]